MQDGDNNLQILKRILKLEKRSREANFCYFISEKNDGEESLFHEFKFEFEVKQRTYLKISLKTLLSKNINCNLTLSINGAEAFQTQFQKERVIESVLPFGEGVNEVTVALTADEVFGVKNCDFETFGNIAYLEKDCTLQVINEQNRSIVTFVNNGELSIKEYKEGVFSSLYKEQNIKGASLCKMAEKYLLVTLDDEGEGKLILFTSEFDVDYDKILDNGLISVCSFGGDVPSVFAVRGEKVYRYDIEEMLFFIKRYTGYTGKKVKSNPEVKGYIIIVDFDGNGKLVQL